MIGALNKKENASKNTTELLACKIASKTKTDYIQPGEVRDILLKALLSVSNL